MLERLFRRVFSPPKRQTPRLSIIVVVYHMPMQAERTIRSLMLDYQVGVKSEDYEVLIVENNSRAPLSESFIASLPHNFRYFLRRNAETSPAAAVNFGAAEAYGENICIMIDGARMLTPGAVQNLLRGHALSDRAVVAIPGYHLGSELQQESVSSGYNTDQEEQLLNSISWPENGYKLFDIACFSGSSTYGFFQPNCESNCISVPASIWRELRGFDERFDLVGGGLINLDYYRRACELPDTVLVMVIGEGTFHQFHGGVTTGGKAALERDRYIEASKAQYRQLRGEDFDRPLKAPVFLGEMPREVLPFVSQSIKSVQA